jgi:hypothetical protein
LFASSSKGFFRSDYLLDAWAPSLMASKKIKIAFAFNKPASVIVK